jgi:Trk K+ transport system NAD-binding subunit
MVGVHFDESALANLEGSPVVFLLILMVLLFAIKIIPGFLWQRIFGAKKALAGSVLMASRLSLIIAASKIGLDFGIITPGMNAAFVLMAVITCLISPLLYNTISPKELLKGQKVIIVGGSSSGVLLARRLKMHGYKAIIIENNKNRYLEMLSKGLNAYYGNGLNHDIYNKINLQPTNYVVALTESEMKNTKICRLLKEEFHHPNIISKSSNLLIEQQLQRLKVEYLDVTRLMATTIENLILRPSTYQTLVETFENYTVEDITITNDQISGNQIKEIPFHKDGELILVRRGEHVEIPHGDTYLQKGDLVTVMGTESAMQDFRRKFRVSFA